MGNACPADLRKVCRSSLSVCGAGSAGVAHKLCARKMLMIDQVTHVMPRGGAHGLGLLIGEKFLERDDWYVPFH